MRSQPGSFRLQELSRTWAERPPGRASGCYHPDARRGGGSGCRLHEICAPLRHYQAHPVANALQNFVFFEGHGSPGNQGGGH
jgi:hypothetical protein